MIVEKRSITKCIRAACRSSSAFTLLVRLEPFALALGTVAAACFASAILGWPVVWSYVTGLALTILSLLLLVVAIALLSGAVARQILEMKATYECLRILLHEGAHIALRTLQEKRLAVPWLIYDSYFVYLVGYMYVLTGIIEQGRDLIRYAKSISPELSLGYGENDLEDTQAVFNTIMFRLRAISVLHWPTRIFLFGITSTILGVAVKFLIGLLLMAYVIRWCRAVL